MAKRAEVLCCRAEGEEKPTNDVQVPAAFLLPIVFSLGGWTDENRAWLSRAGLDEALLYQPDAIIDVATFDRLARESADRSGRPDIGLEQGRMADIRQLGLVGWVMLNAPDLAAALDHFGRYNRLACSGILYELASDGRQASVTFVSALASRDLPRPVMDAVLRSFVVLAEQLLGRPLPLTGLELMHSEDPALYRSIFGVVPRLNRPAYRVEFGAEALAWKIAYADAALLRPFRQQAETRLAALDGHEFAGKVRRVLERWDGAPTLDRVAGDLGLAGRTLQTRLRAEGTTFQAVLETARQEFALRELKEASTSIKEIAWVLGYAELSSFYSSFRRWTGRSPAQVRQGA